MKPSSYFNNLSLEEQQKMFPTAFGSVLFQMYQNIDEYVQELKATRLLLTKKSRFLFKGERIIFQAPEINFEENLSKYEPELRDAFKKGFEAAALAFFNILPLIIDTDEFVKRYMQIVERTEDSIEIEINPA